MSTGQGLFWFWPVHRQFYSYIMESSEITDKTNSSSIPTRPRPCYIVYMLFLSQTMIGWNPHQMMSTGPILGRCWPVHRQSYGDMEGYFEITDPTNISSIPSKTQTVLQSLYLVPITYYYRMQCTPDNVYRPKMGLVLAN
jgi:hypothetical protein